MKIPPTRAPRLLPAFFLLVALIPFSLPAQTIISSANVALHKTATASSVQTDKYTENAFDGDPSTRFSSLYSDSEWISVDLGQVYLIDQVVLTWERAYGKDFDILFSRDGSFTDLYKDSLQIRNNVLGSDSIAGINTLQAKSNTIARYVRMQGVTRATEWGYSLYEFQVSGSISTAGLLPVSITGFTVSQLANASLIEWTTTIERNIAGFSIERSNDGVNFTAIGWVEGSNRGTGSTHYSYIDKLASNSIHYYRLKVFDFNGKTGATQAIAATAPDNTASLKLYPMPAKDHVSIEYRGTSGDCLSLTLFDPGGQPVYRKSMKVRGNLQTLVVNRTSNMLPGMYFLVINTTGNRQYIRQIILQ